MRSTSLEINYITAKRLVYVLLLARYVKYCPHLEGFKYTSAYNLQLHVCVQALRSNPAENLALASSVRMHEISQSLLNEFLCNL
jgi:hypothetical protein